MSGNIDEDKIVDQLEGLGLKEKEAKVYLSLLTLGEVGSSKVIKRTGLHGQFVYGALASLEEKGLVNHVVQNGRKKFRANSPKRIKSLIEHQKDVVDDVITQLSHMASLPEEQQFEVYQGEASYRDHEFGLLEKAKDDSMINIIGGGESNNKFLEFMGEEIDNYEALRIAKKVKVRYIGSKEQEKFLIKNAQERTFFEYKILPGEFSGLVNTNIWPDTVGFNIYGSPVLAFVISNKDIAESYNMFFETLWNLT